MVTDILGSVSVSLKCSKCSDIEYVKSRLVRILDTEFTEGIYFKILQRSLPDEDMSGWSMLTSTGSAVQLAKRCRIVLVLSLSVDTSLAPLPVFKLCSPALQC